MKKSKLKLFIEPKKVKVVLYGKGKSWRFYGFIDETEEKLTVPMGDTDIIFDYGEYTYDESENAYCIKNEYYRKVIPMECEKR